MNATTTAAPEAPETTPTVDPAGSTPQATTSPSTQPATTPVETPLEEMSLQELETALNALGNPKKETAPEETQETPTDEQLDQVQPSPDEQPPGADEDDDTKPLPKNFRFHTEDPTRAKYFRLLKQHPEADPIDLAVLAGYKGKAPGAPQQQPANTPTPEPEVDPLKPLKDEIASLSAKKKEHREAYEYDKADEIGEQLLEKRLELERQTRDLAEQKASLAEYQADYTEARGAAAKLHPDALQPGTRQFRLLRMLVSSKEQEDPSFFSDPNYPLRLLGELERDFPESFPKGHRAAAAAPSSPAPAKPAAQPVKGPPARPVGQAAPGTSGVPKATSAAELLARIDKMSDAEVRALADASGTKTGSMII